MYIIRKFFNYAIALVLVSCGGNENSTEHNKKNSTKQVATPVSVTVTIAQQKTFNHELLCNGTLAAARSAKISFEQQGLIEKVYVHGGQLVESGQLLAEINNSDQQLALERAHNRLAVAKVEMQDFLLGYSSTTDTTNISPQVMYTARTRSGYNEALLSLREAELQLAKTQIKSPIAGTVVDIQAHENHPSSAYTYFCQVIDEQSLQVEFYVLETELQLATLGTSVEVYPFTNTSERCMATITEVNRLVDKNGMVKVVAKLKDNSDVFMVGMNVRALICRPQSNKLVIPIDALTRRQNRDVVFVAVDSMAVWKYVEIGPRNSTEVVIQSGLNAGDMVIVSGNATIGHEAWITY